MRDIENREDIELIVTTFYNKLLNDMSISYIFTDVAKIDMEAHIPQITDFWELVLFNTGDYRNNVVQIHRNINSIEKLTEEHFKTWLEHLEATVKSLFRGPVTENLLTRAVSIGTVMKIKMARE